MLLGNNFVRVLFFFGSCKIDKTSGKICLLCFSSCHYPKAGKFVNLHVPWIYIFARIYIPNLRKLKGKCKFYIFPKNVVFR